MQAHTRRRLCTPHAAVAALTVAVVLLRQRRPLQRRVRALLAKVRHVLSVLMLTLRVLTQTATRAARLLQQPPPQQQQQAEGELGMGAGMEGDAWQLPIVALVEALASPSGQSVVTAAVTAAVREAMRSTGFQHASSLSTVPFPPSSSSSPSAAVATAASGCDANGAAQWAQAVGDVVTSDSGRRLVVDVAQRVTHTALPILMASRPATPSQHSQRGGAQHERAGMVARTVGTAVTPGTTSATTVTQRTAGSMTTVWQQVAAWAMRDPGLTRDVVGIAISQGVRSYLTTNAELVLHPRLAATAGAVVDTPGHRDSVNQGNDGNGDGDGDGDAEAGEDAASRGRGQGVRAADGADDDSTQQGRRWAVGEVATSVWRAVGRRVAMDVRRRMFVHGSGATGSGWTVF